jgi:hypothetical protein
MKGRKRPFQLLKFPNAPKAERSFSTDDPVLQGLLDFLATHPDQTAVRAVTDVLLWSCAPFMSPAKYQALEAARRVRDDQVYR